VTAVAAASVTQDLIFATGTGTSGTERLRITSGGNIQIAGTGNLIWGAYNIGFYAQDTTWIRSINNASIWLNSGSFGTNGALGIGYGGAVGPAGGALFSNKVSIGTQSQAPGMLTVQCSGYAIRLASTTYGIDLYNDNANFYFLLTNSGDPYGGYNGYRPLYINLANGGVTMGNGLSVSGMAYFNSGASCGSSNFNAGYGVFSNIGINSTGSWWLTVQQDSAAKPSTNVWTVFSDIRTKRNVRSFEGGIELIRKLEPIVAEYNGEAGTPEGKRVVSFDAEKLREVEPNSVSTYLWPPKPEDGEQKEYFAFNSHEIFFHMLRAIQQLDTENIELKRRLG
jgi:hypothetical protein